MSIDDAIKKLEDKFKKIGTGTELEKRYYGNLKKQPITTDDHEKWNNYFSSKNKRRYKI